MKLEAVVCASALMLGCTLGLRTRGDNADGMAGHDYCAGGIAQRIEEWPYRPPYRAEQEPGLVGEWALGYRIRLVPIGYPPERMDGLDRIKHDLERAYAFAPVEFLRLDGSLDIPLRMMKMSETDQPRPAFIDDPAVLNRQVCQRYGCDVAAFVFASGEKDHSRTSKAVPLIAGDTVHRSFAAIHEVGHTFGLSDEYERTESGITRMRTIEELAQEDVRILRKRYAPKIELAGRCGNAPLFRFYDGKNVMAIYRDDAKLHSQMDAGEPLFNPLQIAIIDDLIAYRLRGTPRALQPRSAHGSQNR